MLEREKKKGQMRAGSLTRTFASVVVATFVSVRGCRRTHLTSVKRLGAVFPPPFFFFFMRKLVYARDSLLAREFSVVYGNITLSLLGAVTLFFSRGMNYSCENRFCGIKKKKKCFLLWILKKKKKKLFR